MKNSQLLQFVLFCALSVGARTICHAPPPPPPPAIRSEVEAALAKAGGPTTSVGKFHVVLLADKKDHKEYEHDYPLWQDRWALLLGGQSASTNSQVNLYGPAIADPKTGTGVSNVQILRAWNWPTEEQFASANVVVAFCYLQWNDERKHQLKQYLERGGGLVLVHSATWTKPKANEEVAALTGVGGFTKFRHGTLELEITATNHPICQGLPRQLSFLDESYWPPTPLITVERITTLAASCEKTDEQTAPQPMFWTYQSGRGRVFGCVPGHYTWTFDNPWFRILLLRGIAWAGNQPVTCLDSLVLRGAASAPCP